MHPTLKDIAAAARVSIATVDRVVNDRPGVREATRRHVIETAAAMGYAHVAARIAGLDFLLPRKPGLFMERIATLLRAAAAASGHGAAAPMAVRIHHIDYEQPERVAQLLHAIRGSTSGIGIVMLDHLLIREALRSAIDHGIPVLTLLSDISSLPHQGYIGVDNRLAGRLAGHLLGRLIRDPGAVALLTGSQGYRGHEEREMGFRHILRTEFAPIRVLPTVEIGEEPETGFEAMARILDDHADLCGVYCIGAGSQGVARALEVPSARTAPFFVAHELSPATRPYLLSGTIDYIVDENLPALATRAVARLAGAAQHRMLGICNPEHARVITRENVPVD